MNIARLATIGLVAFSVFSTGCIGCIDDEEGNSGTNNANNANNTNNISTPTADCQDGDIQGVVDNGDINTDVVFCGEVTFEDTFRTTGDIDVTIRPGTVINMAVDTYFEVGYAGNEVTFIAEGTTDDPIVFQGTNAEPGHWDRIYLRPTMSSASVFSHVQIRHAGASQAPALDIDNTRDFTFNDVTVEDVDGAGVSANGFGDMPSNLTVTGASEEAVIAKTLNGVHTLPLGGDYTGNGGDVVAIANGDFRDNHVLFADPGVPYRVDDTIRTTGDIDITIEAGVEIQMTTDTYIEFGYAGNEVTLNITGTAADPVRIVGSTPEAGHWDTIYVRDSVTSSSVIEYLEVEHAGSGARGGITFESDVEFSNSTLRNNDNYDFSVDAAGLSPDSENVNCERTDGASAAIHFNAAMTLPTGGSYGSGDAYVEVTNGDFTVGGTVPAIDVPYRVSDTIRTTGDLDLTVESGTIFEMTTDTYFELGYAGNEVTLNMDGVTIRGTDPSPGHWDRFYLRGSVTSASSVTNSTFSHGGLSDVPTVDIENPNITFTGNTINQAAGACIDRNGDMTDYAASNTLDCSGGDYL